MGELRQGQVSISSTTHPESSRLTLSSEHLKESHSRINYCETCKENLKIRGRKNSLEEAIRKHKFKACDEKDWPANAKILSPSQDDGLWTFREVTRDIKLPREDLSLQNWLKMNSSLGFPDVDTNIARGEPCSTHFHCDRDSDTSSAPRAVVHPAFG